MPRIPIAAAFSVQVVVSLIGVTAIVVLFALIHDKAVTNAASDQLRGAVKLAQRLISGPFEVVMPQIRALAATTATQGLACDEFNVMGPAMRRQAELMAPILESNLQFFAVYQSFRFQQPYATAPNGTHDGNDFPWGDCGCVAGEPNFCVHTQYLDESEYGVGAVGWGTSAATMPFNETVTGFVPIDSRQFIYIQDQMTYTEADVGGVWGNLDVYPLPDENGNVKLINYVTFHMPLKFDSVTGKCVSAQNSDVSMGWMANFLASADGPSTKSVLIDTRTNHVLATSFDMPAFNVPNASEPAVGYSWDMTSTPVARLNAAVQRVLDRTRGSLSNLNDIEIIINGGDFVVGAGPIDVANLPLAIIVVTDSSYYFQSGRNALLTAILVGIAVFLLMTFSVVGSVWATVRPLQDISKRMSRTAQLRAGQDLDDYSAFKEINALQKSYTQMNVAVQSFVRYVPKDVVVDLLQVGQLCQIAMTPLRCTMLFADIVSFTTICERVPAPELSRIILQYFNVTSEIVMKHGGLIDKFIGDCIMAVWGAPFAVANGDIKALLCALQLQRATHTNPLYDAFQEAGELLATRVGVNTGEVLAGNMGSVERMNYTVIGDAVNLAARCEGMGKQFGAYVLASSFTMNNWSDEVLCARLVGLVSVVGKAEAVEVYEVIGVAPHAGFRMPDTEPENQSSTDQSESDNASTAVGGSTVEGGNANGTRRTKNGMSASQALRAASEMHDCPIVVSDEMFRRAKKYTTALRDYLKRDFIGALQKLRELEELATTSPMTEDACGMKRNYQIGGTDDVAARKLSRWCVDALQLGSNLPASWDGTFHADSK